LERDGREDVFRSGSWESALLTIAACGGVGAFIDFRRDLARASDLSCLRYSTAGRPFQPPRLSAILGGVESH